MLHEILLSLSGHPSPLLRKDISENTTITGITPPERELLASLAHLSEVHIWLISSVAQISSSHPSVICRAVAGGIKSIHLAAFQTKVLDVEQSILRNSTELVGAYNIVPVTAVVGEFQPWVRKMDWLWRMVQLIQGPDGKCLDCSGAQIIDMLRAEVRSGYQDVAEAAESLVAVAEVAWLKQVSAWVLYGRLPSFGAKDFFIQKQGEEYTLNPSLLPSFVSSSTSSSVFFVGKSLNHPEVKSVVDSGFRGLAQLSFKLQEFAGLTHPLDRAMFSRVIISMRLSLSETTLQRVLPQSRVLEMMHLLRDFFLLGRGDFAMALTHEADKKVSSRWKRADNLAYEKGDNLRNVTIKDGEVAAVLARVWVNLAATQGQAYDDEAHELARGLLQFHLTRSKNYRPVGIKSGLSSDKAKMVSNLPFNSLLFSAPAELTVRLPAPLDMVFSPSDLQLYSSFQSYLLSMRRAHIRLTDLWKITTLRRHHPAIRGAGEHAVMLRKRWVERSAVMRNSWTTASAAIFFLGETEAYLQHEIVAVMWDGFRTWMTGGNQHKTGGQMHLGDAAGLRDTSATLDPGADNADDLWLQEHKTSEQPQGALEISRSFHDPQILASAHGLYLRSLTHRLLLTSPSFTAPLYNLLVQIDHLVTHIHRLHSLFTSIDLESDAGVVEAFVDLQVEEVEVKALLKAVEGRVKDGVEETISALRRLESDPDFTAEWEGEGAVGDEEDAEDWGVDDNDRYAPARVGGINRLLMKLDFGSWFEER